MKHLHTIDGVPTAALEGSMRDYRVIDGTDLIARCEEFYNWQNTRREAGVWPFGRSTETGPAASCAVRDDSGNLATGINFASQDYLSLAVHRDVHDAARRTIDEFGVHSAGSSALVGNISSSIALEQKIADFMKMDEALLFSTGWQAGFGVIKGLVRSSDYIVMDQLAHACLQTGAQAATRNVSLFRHNDVEHCRKRLEAIREREPRAAIMVVTESLFSMDSDTPDIAALQDLAHEFDATLMVDVAHDLGALGPAGTGHIGMQNMLGKVDLVMGSFSKTFASNGGFVATNKRAVKEYLRFYSPSNTFTNALSPIQVAIVDKAFDIVSSSEGDMLRDKLMGNIILLRQELRTRGLDYYGDPSAIVAVKTGDEALARMTARALPEVGLIANLVEYPAVGKGLARFRMQVMAGHDHVQVRSAASRIQSAMETAKKQLDAGIDQDAWQASA